MFLLQVREQLELDRYTAEQEQSEYDELLKWLDGADELLKVVDRNISDRDQEYTVSSHCVFNVIENNCSTELEPNFSPLDAKLIYHTASTECVVPFKWHKASKGLSGIKRLKG